METTDPDVPELAPMDRLGREIQAVLDLVRPQTGEEAPKFSGYGLTASEAYLHLARDRGEPKLRVMRHGTGEGAHWWLVDGAGRIIDLTLSPADRRRVKAAPEEAHPYGEGRGAMFRTGPNKPSKRAAALIELVRSRSE